MVVAVDNALVRGLTTGCVLLPFFLRLSITIIVIAAHSTGRPIPRPSSSEWLCEAPLDKPLLACAVADEPFLAGVLDNKDIDESGLSCAVVFGMMVIVTRSGDGKVLVVFSEEGLAIAATDRVRFVVGRAEVVMKDTGDDDTDWDD